LGSPGRGAVGRSQRWARFVRGRQCMRSPKGRLELTWMGKDMALIPTAHGKYDYVAVLDR
jgi:hypothetical protein